ncbi:protein-methionine-sulfoxide reductase heme-binding subunit MsrQ [Testudinibacter sp. TR-2022]|uniref:protein-methionine-sulfoxide reductase heme-binding subunit MsrQ n=1 Tax=Testudinibacter sp. TR-2022 TaxID=2585029 RepID=UPI00111B7621|nr:protein-methionine-sulfoxide reductase heme-binding subunit MsrQ [Testudinibacter sp. TR-2022]TNH09446.1 sulfoxide reductase heme-binding subunit YedZ [Pasteurellaceae bacterium Phil11]TNH20961.1 sulfoxide reductase heme-binding subunit YedZ [Testudinibacter sp. TR-2022]TNH28412.1 sulfoxide reductase heme-binding subunit YedZ [Testudinibacter sp. TR-2022]
MFNFLRLTIHCAGLLPLLWLGYILNYGDISLIFGADPIKELIHFLGLTALYFFAALFSLRIINRLYGKGRLLALHKTLGLWGLFWLSLHILSYLALELAFDYRLFLNEIIKRPYLIVGVLAFVFFLLPAASSIPMLRHKLAKNWFILHQLSNLAIVLAIIHYYWSTKGIALQPLIFLVFAIMVLAWKFFSNQIIAYKNKTRQF